ncbi:MAG: ABC transporter ATP-binding protein [Firmicutes bacterium]|nr:ABC transporter ATP-binding protein [Bacillota bacterium]
MSQIILDHVTKQYGDVVVLNDFSAEFEDGEFITLLGPSGCGKTTMLRMIAGFEKPTSGTIKIDGVTVSSADTFVPPEKRGLGMVFQSYAVWPHMNVFDNVAYPLKIRKLPKQEIRDKVMRVLEAVHLDQYEKRLPSQLSGGQQQRVALGRALVAEPKVLLLDEPLSNLDAKLREEMRYEIKDIQRRLHINIVYVTHDQSEAMTMSDRVFVIYAGELQQVGSPVEIYRHPRNQFVADFVGKVNFLKGTSQDGKILLDGVSESLDYSGDLTGPVDVAIRPENARLVRGGGQLPCRILSEFFMGDENDCLVQVGERQIHVASDAASYGQFGAEEPVGLEIREFLVFPQSGEEFEQILT